MRVEQFVRDSAARFPGKVALVAGDRRLTYAEIDEASDRLASGLAERGVEPRDRVLLFLENCADAVVAIFGVLKAGATFSMVHPTTKPERLAYLLSNSGAAALIAHHRLLPVARAARAAAPETASCLLIDAESVPGEAAEAGVVSLVELLENDGKLAPIPAGQDADLAMLVYTSGSTGDPKGVMLSHGNVVTAVRSITTYLENTSDDVLLGVLPITFSYGLNQVMSTFYVGATLVLEKTFAFPYLIIQHLVEEQVTGFAMVPTIAALLLQQKDLAPGQFPHLRYITNAAAALPPAHLQRMQELFPTTRIYSMHGLTECTRTLYLPPDQINVRPDSVGHPIPGTEAYLVDEHGERLGPNQVGELVIKGGHVMQGYWRNPEATNRCIRADSRTGERVLHTGDLFRMDAEGFFYFVSRNDDIIKTRGEKVSPRDVENVLCTLSGVAEAAVVGVPDAVLGQAVKAVIVPTAEGLLTEKDVRRHCAMHLEDYKVPKVVEFRAELPKTGSGKILRREMGTPPVLAHA